MFRSVFLKALRDQRRSFAGWSVSLVALVALMAAMWPSIRDMPDLDALLAGYPEALRELFDIAAITTGAGWLNVELYSIVLPALFVVHGISRGAKLLAGEEEAGTLEVLLVTPLSRTRLLADKAAALLVPVAGLGVVLFVATVVAAAAAGMDVAVAHAAVGALAMVLLGALFGLLALAVGAAVGRRSVAVALPAGLAVAAYLLYVLGRLVEAIEPWAVASPIGQVLEPGPIGDTPTLAFLWVGLAGLAVVAVAAPVFARRDVAAS